MRQRQTWTASDCIFKIIITLYDAGETEEQGGEGGGKKEGEELCFCLSMLNALKE